MPVRYEYIGKPLGKTEYISTEEQRKQLQHRTVATNGLSSHARLGVTLHMRIEDTIKY